MAEITNPIVIAQIMNRDRNEYHRQARKFAEEAGALARAFDVLHMDGMAKGRENKMLEQMLHNARDIIGIRFDVKMDDALNRWRLMREMDLKMKKMGIKLTLPQSDEEAMR